MSLSTIRAHMECDGCGKPMSFDLDAACNPPAGWSLFDVAVDACRGGHVREGRGLSSVQGESEKCLCAACTSTVDAIETPDDRNATDAEIAEALEAELYAPAAQPVRL